MASVEQRPVAVEPPASREGPRPVLLNPRSYDPADFDEATRRALLATIDFFESRGKIKLKDLAVMSRQFAVMINSGLSLLRALSSPRAVPADP